MSATIPITLTPVPVPVGVKATDINQLVTIITQYIAGSINQDVSFFQIVSVDPTQQTTPLIFNTSQGVFKYWDTTVGRYTPVTPFQPGDIKNTFSGGDSPQTGWIDCDGRVISTIPNISANQQGVLNALFGAGGTLPTLTPLQGVSDLPASNAFSDVPVLATTPPANQIANLPFSSDYNPVEPQNLASNTEQLRGSQNDLRTSVTSMQTLSNQLLNAFTAPVNGLVAQVFVGYP
ncbi:MAG: hypothetical protein JW395_3170 [Nitrospira sp.]|jgi:hypothetical protein|nr:hypothetical protein [Nitrospira sp.]